MVNIYVRHYLAKADIDYLKESWFPKVKETISQ